MAIERTKSFKTSDGKVYLNEAEAQIHELEILLAVGTGQDSDTITNSAIKFIVEHKTEVLAILNTRKPRTPKAKRVKKEQVAA